MGALQSTLVPVATSQKVEEESDQCCADKHASTRSMSFVLFHHSLSCRKLPLPSSCPCETWLQYSRLQISVSFGCLFPQDISSPRSHTPEVSHWHHRTTSHIFLSPGQSSLNLRRTARSTNDFSCKIWPSLKHYKVDAHIAHEHSKHCCWRRIDYNTVQHHKNEHKCSNLPALPLYLGSQAWATLPRVSFLLPLACCHCIHRLSVSTKYFPNLHWWCVGSLTQFCNPGCLWSPACQPKEIKWLAALRPCQFLEAGLTRKLRPPLLTPNIFHWFDVKGYHLIKNASIKNWYYVTFN